jgi:hypothetical protein
MRCTTIWGQRRFCERLNEAISRGSSPPFLSGERTRLACRQCALASRNFTITRKVGVPVSLYRTSTGGGHPKLVAPERKRQKMLRPDRVMWRQEQPTTRKVILWRTKKRVRNPLTNKAEKAANRAATRARPADAGVKRFTPASMTARATTSIQAGRISRAGSAAR